VECIASSERTLCYTKRPWQTRAGLVVRIMDKRSAAQGGAMRQIKTVPALLAALRQPGPWRAVTKDEDGYYVSLADWVCPRVQAEVVRAAIVAGAIVEMYPSMNLAHWCLPARRRGRPRKVALAGVSDRAAAPARQVRRSTS